MKRYIAEDILINWVTGNCFSSECLNRKAAHREIIKVLRFLGQDVLELCNGLREEYEDEGWTELPLYREFEAVIDDEQKA